MPHIVFVTGKLAEPALRRTLEALTSRTSLDYSVAVLPITVVALANTDWIVRHLTPPPGTSRVCLPGLCGGDLGVFRAWGDVNVERGPKDLRDLPEYLGHTKAPMRDYGAYDVSILAEINFAPRLPYEELLGRAKKAQADGADVIDLGCDPGATWTGIGDAVQALRGEGLRVSLDTFNVQEAEEGIRAGAELVLSVNKSNRQAARSWGCEVVAVPDQPADMEGLDATMEFLAAAGVPFRIDLILEPIGFGFAASLGRYLEARRRWPAVEMMMGVGNVTELTDVDSAGVNVVLMAFCQELGVRSVLTTEVINWSRTCVRELDLARRLVHYAYRERLLPKHIEPALIMLRDPKLREYGEAVLEELARNIADRNFRIFAERDEIHVMSSDMHLRGADPFALFAQMAAATPIDSAHAFYLGYEMAKAATALALGKNYVQDQALRWGFLTRPEASKHPPDSP